MTIRTILKGQVIHVIILYIKLLAINLVFVYCINCGRNARQPCCKAVESEPPHILISSDYIEKEQHAKDLQAAVLEDLKKWQNEAWAVDFGKRYLMSEKVMQAVAKANRTRTCEDFD